MEGHGDSYARPGPPPTERRPRIEPVVSANWLEANLEQVVVADVRWYLDGRSGKDAFARGHIPRARWVDLDRHLAGPPDGFSGRHPLPDPSDFAASMSALGIGDDSVTVAYDDAGGTVAARLVWMLRSLGADAALLDGGMQAWQGRIETSHSSPDPASFSARPWPESAIASIEDVAGAQGPIVDARAAERYQGIVEPIDPQAGHIPGATNLPCGENLGPDGRFLAPQVLKAAFAKAGLAQDTDAIVYCGSGVNACHHLVAMEFVGLTPARLYVGSWSQWSSTPGREIELGEGENAADRGRAK